MNLLGGGVRGIMQLIWLRRIIEEVPDFLDRVFGIGGTSIGAGVGAALALRFDMKQAEKSLTQAARAVFKNKFYQDWLPYRLINAQYDVEKMFREYFNVFGDLKLGDLLIPYLATTIDIGVKPSKPKIFQSFTIADNRFRIADVCTGSGAAPTGFSAWPIEDLLCLDGGTFALDPTECLISQAQDCFNTEGHLDPSNMRVLTLGTGFENDRRTRRTDGNWGLVEVAESFVELTVDAVAEVTRMRVTQKLGENRFFLDDELPRSIGYDEPEAIPTLVELAEKTDLSLAMDWLAPKQTMET